MTFFLSSDKIISDLREDYLVRFFKLSRAQMLAAMTGIGLLTAALGFGDSLLRFLKPEGDQDSGTTKSDGPTVVHNVEHRSGTQAQDMLSGPDDLVITEAKFTAEPDYPTETHSLLNLDEMMVEYCAPHSFRVLNATDTYIEAGMGILSSGNVWSIGIGPGERYSSEPLDSNIYIFWDKNSELEHIIPIHDC